MKCARRKRKQIAKEERRQYKRENPIHGPELPLQFPILAIEKLYSRIKSFQELGQFDARTIGNLIANNITKE